MVIVPNKFNIVAATTIALAIAGVATAAALFSGPSSQPQQFRDDGGEVLKAMVSPVDESSQAELKVNGKSVPLNESGTTHFKSDGTEGTVTVNDDDGDNNSSTTVNISVDSHSTDGKTRSNTRINTSGSSRTTSHSSVNIHGEGQVNTQP